MERKPSKLDLSRRDVLVGVLGFSAGALATLGGVAIADTLERAALAPAEPTPLKPENGSAQNHLAIEWLPETVTRWKPQIEKYGHEYDVDPNLLAIMMTVESGGDPDADSGVAKGLMQVTDGTAKEIAANYLNDPVEKYDLAHPETNIEFGAAYVRYLIRRFGNASQGPSWDQTVTLVAAGYNGGPGAAMAYKEEGWKALERRKDQQTLFYARYVHMMWQERHDPRSFTYYHWYNQANGQALVKNAENDQRH